MSVRSFLDTNVVVYAASGRGPDEWKRRRAFEVMGPADFGLSAQVLQEFYVTVTKKQKVLMTPSEASVWVENLSVSPVCAIDESIVQQAISLSTRYRIAYWDAALVAAARHLGAPVIFSEDLNHGQVYAGVEVVNPFRNI